MTQIQIDRATGLRSSAAYKAPCIAVTSADVSLSGEQTIGGIDCIELDRVLVNAQDDATENGIWLVSTGDWERPPDFRQSDDIVRGTQVRVITGTGAGVYVLTTADPVIGTSELSFTSSIALDYAPLDSPIFTGNPRVPTATPGDNDTTVASTAFVTNAAATAAATVAATAAEAAEAAVIANALGGDPDFSDTLLAAIAAVAATVVDYEVGTPWTPGLTFGGATTGITYSHQEGWAIKIGQLVVAIGHISLTNNGSVTGVAKITGLPYDKLSESFIGGVFIMGTYSNLASIVGTPTGLVDATDSLSLYNGHASTAPALTDTNITNTADFYFAVIYPAAA